MSAKGFLHLSAKDSLEAYKGVLHNANVKWASAMKIAEAEDFGTATSVAVSSIEELIKSVIIAMNGYGFEFRKAPLMDKFFKNHQIRYVVAYGMFLVNVMSEEFKKLFFWLKSNPAEGIAWMKDLFQNKDYHQVRMQAYMRLKLRLIKQEFEWFEKADTFRQEGMYTDFDGVLKSPLTVSSDVFKETIYRLSKVRQVGISIIETLESKDEVFVKHYAFMRQRFIDDDYYGKIQSALASMKRPQVPFESLRAFVNGR